MTHWINTHFWTTLAIAAFVAFTLSELWWMLFIYGLCTINMHAQRRSRP